MLSFAPLEVAEVCLPFEAAEWIALGRLPQIWISDYEVEARSDIRSLIEDYTVESEAYKQGELEALGIEVDYPEYIDLFYNCRIESVDELFNGGESVSPSLAQGPPSPDIYRQIALLERIDTAVHPHLERAQLMVLLVT